MTLTKQETRYEVGSETALNIPLIDRKRPTVSQLKDLPMSFSKIVFQNKAEFYDAWKLQNHKALTSFDFAAYKLWKSYFAGHSKVATANCLAFAFRAKKNSPKPFEALQHSLAVIKHYCNPGFYLEAAPQDFKDKLGDLILFFKEYDEKRPRAKPVLPHYTYIWIRKDLPVVHQIIQAGHAIQVAAREQPHLVASGREVNDIVDNFVLFEVENERELQKVKHDLFKSFGKDSRTYSTFTEPTTPGAIGFNAIATASLRKDDPRREALTKYKLYGTDLPVVELLKDT